jgi:hypothetical protein
LQGFLQCFNQIGRVDVSGLWVRSHVNSGQDGFGDTGSKQQSNLIEGHWVCRPIGPAEGCVLVGLGRGNVSMGTACGLGVRLNIAETVGGTGEVPHLGYLRRFGGSDGKETSLDTGGWDGARLTPSLSNSTLASG